MAASSSAISQINALFFSPSTVIVEYFTLDNPKSDKECVSNALAASASLNLFPGTILRVWWRKGADLPRCATPACRPGASPTSFAPSKNNTDSHFCCLISAFLLFSFLVKSDQSKQYNLFDLTWCKFLLGCDKYLYCESSV